MTTYYTYPSTSPYSRTWPTSSNEDREWVTATDWGCWEMQDTQLRLDIIETLIGINSSTDPTTLQYKIDNAVSALDYHLLDDPYDGTTHPLGWFRHIDTAGGVPIAGDGAYIPFQIGDGTPVTETICEAGRLGWEWGAGGPAARNFTMSLMTSMEGDVAGITHRIGSLWQGAAGAVTTALTDDIVVSLPDDVGLDVNLDAGGLRFHWEGWNAGAAWSEPTILGTREDVLEEVCRFNADVVGVGTRWRMLPGADRGLDIGATADRINAVYSDNAVIGALIADGDVAHFDTYGATTLVSTGAVVNPGVPTDAELDTAFPAGTQEGFVGILDEGGAGTNIELCCYANSAWWYIALTKAL